MRDADRGRATGDDTWHRVAETGVILIDNVLWSGRVLAPQEASDKAICAFNEHARQDKRVEIAMLPVRDGMLLARKI